MKLLTADQMRELDRCAIEDYGVPGVVLMENAGRGAAEFIDQRYGAAGERRALVVAGKGNNGGDGYVIARHLHNWGWQVTTLILADRATISGDAEINLRVLECSGATIQYATTENAVVEALASLADVELVVDAIFGNGLSSNVRGHYCVAIEQLNQLARPCVAIDLPSGVDATSGQVLGVAVEAQCSLTFAFAKLGQVNFPAQRYGGELKVVELGMPRALLETVGDQYLLVEAQDAQCLLPQRPADGHKGTFGHALVVGGSQGKGGAVQMAASACLRSGCGLVTLATPSVVQPTLAGAIPEVMTVALPHSGSTLGSACWPEIERASHDKAVVALGPGLSQGDDVAELVRQVVAQIPHPLVIDADGLNGLADQKEIFLQRAVANIVVTPHPGEMARLTGLSIDHIQNNRCEVARDFARQWQVVVVLKGARTVIAAPDGRIWINSTGNAGMGMAGMGDILTGVIAGWIAQGLPPFNAAVLGVFLHGMAGDRCALMQGEAGYLATDLLPQLVVARQLLKEMQ